MKMVILTVERKAETLSYMRFLPERGERIPGRNKSSNVFPCPQPPRFSPFLVGCNWIAELFRKTVVSANESMVTGSCLSQPGEKSTKAERDWLSCARLRLTFGRSSFHATGIPVQKRVVAWNSVYFRGWARIVIGLTQVAIAASYMRLLKARLFRHWGRPLCSSSDEPGE